METLLWKSFVFTLFEKLFGLRKKFNAEKKSDEINNILVYGSNDTEEWKRQVGLNNHYYILYMIRHAEKTIDISIPSLESDTLTKALLVAKTMYNVDIRIIVHKNGGMSNLRCLLEEDGICVKVIRPTVKLEHEFIIIDADCSNSVAILGSLDYEVTRVNCNKDITLLSSDTALISPLQREFNRAWSSVDETQMKKFDEINKISNQCTYYSPN